MSFCCRMECDGPCQYQSSGKEWSEWILRQPWRGTERHRTAFGAGYEMGAAAQRVATTADINALKEQLREAGLTIVGPAERAVLDAMAAVPDIQIDMTLDLRDDLSIQETRVWEAELARRAAKEGT